ncbi:hypothetical protein CEK28_08675 [Xenophilus sp. AP218F]|nr:hypothetical protein CEK28_08675 [Xenophilus sp. AP218F]
MIIAFANSKGGVSKSTTAFNLAVTASLKNVSTVLVDGDIRQRSCLKFNALRNKYGLPTLNVQEIITAPDSPADAFGAGIVELSTQHELVVVDVGGYDSTELRQCLLVADIVVVPTQTSQADLQELPEMLGHIQAVEALLGRPPVVRTLITRAYTNTFVRDWEKGLDTIGKYPALLQYMPPLPVILYERQAYREALEQGKSVTELQGSRVGDVKAADEINRLFETLFAGAK